MPVSFGPDTAPSLGPFLTPLPPRVWLHSGTRELESGSPHSEVWEMRPRRLRQDEPAPVWCEVGDVLASRALVP